MWTFTDLECHTCLILGELNCGKTTLTQELLNEALALGRSVAVIDMAPERSKGVGGKLVCKSSTCDYYTTDIVTPRLSGKTEEEIIELAELNKERIDLIFAEYKPKNTLFINDVSLYLQRGSVDVIGSILKLSCTSIMNGYFGASLGEDPFSTEEMRKMVELQRLCDRIIWR